MSEESDWIEIKGNDLALKIIESKKSGDDAKPINTGDSVLVEIVGRQTEAPTYSECEATFEEGPLFQRTGTATWLVKVGDKDLLVPALDMALTRMKAGQTALVYSKPQFALQDGTRTFVEKKNAPQVTIPPNSTVVYKLTATQIVQDTSRLNPYFTITAAQSKKNIANDLYQHEWMSRNARERSVRLYTRLATDMKTLLDGHYFANVEEGKAHPQRVQTRQLLLDGWNNIVAVHMRAKQWEPARTAVEKVLKEDPKNLKALVRNCKIALQDPSMTLEQADEVLKQAEDVVVYKDREEVEIRKLRNQWKQRKKEATPSE